MRITHLSLTNFRNYGRLELDLPAGPILLHGDNAQGKTNFLEAIWYLATTRSPQADQDIQLINWTASETAEPIVVGRLIATVEAGGALGRIEVRLIRERQGERLSFRREVLINGKKVRLMDLLGHLRVVLFLPQDINLIDGAPALRRRYLDITLCQTDQQYCRALSQYNKILEQRNALLRQIGETGRGRELLPIYNDQLTEYGAILFVRRARFLQFLARQAQRVHYEQLTEGKETIRLHYLPRLEPVRTRELTLEEAQPFIETADWLAASEPQTVAARLAAALIASEEQDVLRQRTNVGPHRDDWRFWVNRRSLSSFGSRGQQRTALLALKLAEISWFAEVTGETPILLLDEVVAELDGRRRDLLLQTVAAVSQSILTATEPGMFTAEFIAGATTIEVRQGQLSFSPAGRPLS
ncbi:MAG: DNA replication/repair protein RecF [Ardenticatenales bacterium]|nr:DNA replication/repair protein RecF [Ardenticatenales bacterium]